MNMSKEQVDAYHSQGYTLVENVLDGATLSQLQAEISNLLDGAAGLTEHSDVYDLEDTHRPDRPRVRRIKQPHTHTRFFDHLVRSDAILDPIRQLIGPDVRLQNSKLNLKSAGFGAAVEWHQDWAFYPHTNDDILAIGIFVNDVDADNGPLMVIPGSHLGPVHDHHHAGVFCGAIDLASAGIDPGEAVKLTGPAGSMSIHHVRLVHGSDLNRSGRDRGLLLYEMCAGDAWPLAGILTPFGEYSGLQSRMLCGSLTNMPRVANVPVRIPAPLPADASSIYQTQSNIGQRHFAAIKDEAAVA